jgi:hypothetical protein
VKENGSDYIDFAEFKEVISEISQESHIRFSYFDFLKPKLHLSITLWILSDPGTMQPSNGFV